MNTFSNYAKHARKKKKKNLDKNKDLEIELVKIKYADYPSKLDNALREVIKMEINDMNFHEIRDEVIKEYNGAFEMDGSMVFDEKVRKTNIRFRNFKVFENFINGLDENGYEIDDSNFTGFI